MVKTIGIVGAGAKAAAIVARATVLRELHASEVPKIVVFEKEHIGASWSGGGKFSSGFLPLCTPGEKDVGFPYDETVAARWGITKKPVSPVLYARFSWGAHLVATAQIADWIDRGRHHPAHRKWANYLAWVFKTAGQSITTAEVTSVQHNGNNWDIAYDKDGKSSRIAVDGVVLTGPGDAKVIPVTPDVPEDRIFNAATFWSARQSIVKLKEGNIAVAGDGGSAGSIVAWLSENFAENDQVFIESISPMGTLFPRGDGHAERRWFSDPSNWSELSKTHRKKLLDRTEAGVVSMRVKNLIDQVRNVGYRHGKAMEAEWHEDEIKVKMSYNEETAADLKADYLISAIGSITGACSNSLFTRASDR